MAASEAEGKPLIDETVPHSARIWNYWLGGKDNYAVDRQAGDEYRRAFPGVDELARQARHFLVRTIRYLAEDAGVRQFLDVGTGLPTVDNTHEVAQRIAPEARVVYVDNDPLVLAHAHALLTSTPEGVTQYVDADLLDPDAVLAKASGTLDLTRPVGLILSGVLGHVSSHEEAVRVVRTLVDALPPGSCLSLHDATDEDAGANEAADGYAETGAVPYLLRTREQIAAFFDGLEAVPPGLVPITQWHPEHPGGAAAETTGFGGVALKR